MGAQEMLALGLVAAAVVYLARLAWGAFATTTNRPGTCGGGCGSCASKGQGPDVVSLSPPRVNGKR